MTPLRSEARSTGDGVRRDVDPKMYRIINGVNTPLPTQPPIRTMRKFSFGAAEAINNQDHVAGYHLYVQEISPNQSTTRQRAFYW